MPFSLFSRKKPTRRFTDFYADWFKTLTDNCIPLLRQSLSSAASASVLSSNVDLVLRHLVLYYEALDLAADPNTIPYLLFPSWRNSLETPFLFLGDIHPYLLTNLLRSFIDRENRDHDSDYEDSLDLDLDLVNQPLKIATAWKDPSDELVKRIDQIECTMRLMIPVLMDRMRKAQRGFVARASENWVSSYQEGKKIKKTVTAVAAAAAASVDVAANEEMEELVSIFVDANRLRKSVIMDIVGATSEHQAALFLEGLCQFLIGFKDQVLLQDFEVVSLPN